MNYRREIDGLRALAVLPVILFHAGSNFFSGGFIGVDIFFVISGYLITGMILADLQGGKFSLKHFYARRARRILPALFVVMLACIPFALWFMLPSQYADFSRSLIAVVLFVSNIYFWHESGYFAAEASEKPLLHSWSLGVEEQYYLLFPLALLLLWRIGRRPALYAILLVTAVSFILCEYGARHAPVANFFLIPSRAWELLIGALCAYSGTNKVPKPNNALSITGLMAVLFAMVVYDEHLPVPSALILLPVAGTACILRYGTQGTWVARMLSWQPFVAVGLISYSAYLWHHPLFAFARISTPTAPTVTTMLGFSLMALLLGAVTWRFIEQPFRNQRHAAYVGNRQALYVGIGVALILLIAGALGHISDGRFAYWKANADRNQVRAFELIETAKVQPRFYDNGDCIFNINELTEEASRRLIACHKKYGSGVAIIGDSHAINLFYVLKAQAGTNRFIAGISQGMCRPHNPLPTCYYDRLQRLVESHPTLFHDIIYKQAGFHLLQDAYGNEIERGNISGLALDARVPDFTPIIASIDAVEAYLRKLAQFSNVIWVGPRIEPQIRESVIVQQGCDHVFSLRPNQREVFVNLDRTIAKRLAESKIHYRSQIELMHFNMTRDFINCDKTYFVDGDHYSTDGEARFGSRITLKALLEKQKND